VFIKYVNVFRRGENVRCFRKYLFDHASGLTVSDLDLWRFDLKI